MLQDVEAKRRTEIDVINGAIIAAGRQHGVATPHNDAMVNLIRALEGAYLTEPRKVAAQAPPAIRSLPERENFKSNGCPSLKGKMPSRSRFVVL